MWFLIEYDRPTGTLINVSEFLDAERYEAERSRLSLEINLNRQKVNHEVVILQAEDQIALRKTHRRYFENLEELVTG